MKTIAATVVLLVTLGAGLSGYVFLGNTWPDGSVVMHLQAGSSSGTLLDGTTSWNQSAEAALWTWNQSLRRVQFRHVAASTSPIREGDGINNVFWASSVYGRGFGSSVAVATSWTRGTTRTEGDVIFNTSYSWNSYSGNLRPSSAGGWLYDFRRVALHEFGHVLGLNHPDQAGQSVSTIMHSLIGNVDRLQADDIAAVTVLYGGLSQPGPTATTPGPPSGLTAGSAGTNVSLSWRAPTTGTPTSYRIEAGSASGSSNLANVSTGSTATTFSAGGVGAGVYYIRVKAANGAAVSTASNEAILIVGGGGGGGCSGAPTAPAALLGSASGGTVRLSWGAAGGTPTAYIVEAGSGPGLSNLANSDTGSAVTSLTAPGVGRGTYYIRVRGKNTCGVGAASNEIVVIVQ